MTFKSKLYNISKDLKAHKRTRDELFVNCVEDRLQQALMAYDEEIAESYNYLQYRNGLRVLKKINRKKLR